MQFLKSIFEQELQAEVDKDGNVLIGETSFSPVTILGSDLTAYDDEFRSWLNDVWLPRQLEKLDELLQLHGNAGRFSDLCDAIGRDYVVPFVGSGMSSPSGLPMWSNFLRQIRKFSKTTVDELEELLGKGCFEEAAELLYKTMPKRLFDERIEQDLRINGPKSVKGPVWLLPSIFTGLVLTLNLDEVLEIVYNSEQRPFSNVLAGADIRKYRQRRGNAESFILKLHGDRRWKEGRALTGSEYDAVYGDGSVICEELALIYRTKQLLCLGCSLGADRVVQLIEHVASSDENTPRHFAFLSMPSDNDTRLSREHFLTERGIFPIWYDNNHDSSIQALLVGIMKRCERL